MISMDFLSKRVAGTEFIDFQNTEFYEELSACIKEHIRDTGAGEVFEETAIPQLQKLVELYTGFSNVTFKFADTGNPYVDTGYFSPNHVLNNAGVDQLVKSSDTTLYRWFTENKVKVFKGGIDYRTGRVTGAFKTIPITLGINRNFEQYFPRKGREKWGVPPEGILASVLTHELGHAFAGCMMMLTVLEDNLVAQAALSRYRGATRTEDRVVVLKDTAALLAMKPAKIEELMEFAKGENDESFLLYFTKLTTQRNSQRALSVGVPQMTAEVVADMYAIRMGCSKGIVAAIGTMVDRGVIVPLVENFLMSITAMWLSAWVAVIPGINLFFLFGVMISVFTLTFILGFFAHGYSDINNAGHRRLEDAIRQLIAKVQDNKSMPSNEKAALVKEITHLLEEMKKLQPWFEGTVIHRMMGWVFAGSDFKLREIEHFTQALNNNEIILLPEQLKGV